MGKTKPKTRPNPRVEFRPHADRPWLDEIVAHDVSMIHVEQMNVDSFWMGIYFSKNPKVRVSCWFEVGAAVKDEDGVETRELRLMAAKQEI